MATSTDEDSDNSGPRSKPPGFRFSLKLRERFCKTKKKPHTSSYFEENVVTIQVSLYTSST